MKRLVILDESARVIFHAVLVGSIYLLFAGHNQPGGGFVGGLVAGSAISLRYLAGGIDGVRSLSRFRPWTILGSGLLIASTTAIVPMLRGDPVLSSLGRDFELPLIGSFYASTTLAFDIGVYLVVIGLVFMIFEAFGEESDAT
ncbi:MAG: MnhB domain-containing protein [Acidimicrobiia bacterium]